MTEHDTDTADDSTDDQTEELHARPPDDDRDSDDIPDDLEAILDDQDDVDADQGGDADV